MPPPKHPSELRDHLGFWLRMVSNAVSQSFARQVEAEGVTVAEWVFLRALFNHDRIAPTQLAEHIGVTKGAVSRLADRLIEKRLIERVADPQDKRSQLLALNPMSRRLVPRLAAIADQNDAAFFGALAASERRQLDSLLRKIAAANGVSAVPAN